MMFSDVDLLFTNSLSDDLNQNSVTSGVSSNFTCVFARTQTKKLKVLASSSKCIVYFDKMFCWKSFLLIFVSLSIHICV